MMRQVLLYSVLICFLVGLNAAEDKMPDELKLKPEGATDNNNSNNGINIPPTNNEINNQQNSKDNNQLPPTSTELYDSINDNNNNYQQNHNFNQQNPLGPFRPLIQPESLFDLRPFNMFGDLFRRNREMMDKQFQQLERQAGEGQDVSYFSRNGVSYVRTCTTKRV